MLRPFLAEVALFSRRHYRPVFAVTAVLVAVSIGLASRLRFETDVLALLPQEEPVVDTFREALGEFGSMDFLLVAVRLPEDTVLEPYEAFVDLIGERLERIDLFSEVEYRLGDLEALLQEFLPTSLLFLGEGELERIAEMMSDDKLAVRAGELRRLVSTPQSLAAKSLIKLDPFGLAPFFLDRVSPSQAGLSLDWTSGYLLSRDRRMLLVLAKPERPAQDVDFAKLLVGRVEAELADLTENWPKIAGTEALPAPEVVLAGRYVIALGDESLIRRDAIANLFTSSAGVLLLFLLAFRRFGLLLYAFMPLACGLIFTFGLSSVAFGGLSAATSGTAALLIGLGIDFVIVSYGRYVEERRRGVGLEDALASMSRNSGRAVVVGAITSAATFYSFGVTDFTGLYQMGYLTGTGILFCMVTVLLLLPAMLAWSEDRHARRRSFPRLRLHGFGSGRWIRFAIRHPWAMLSVGVTVTGLAAFSLADLRFEDSVSAMRPKGNPATAIREEIGSRFGTSFAQMMLIVRGDSAEEVLELVEQAAAEVRPLVDGRVLNGFDALDSLLPPPARQRQALEWLAERRGSDLDPERIRSTFTAALTAEGLRRTAFEQGMELFLSALTRSRTLTIEDLESSVQASKLVGRYLHRTEEGGWKSALYLYPPADAWRREPPPAARAVAAALGDRAVLTGANVVSEFLRARVLRDAVIAAILGFVLVALLLWIDFRKLKDTFLSLVPLTMGIVWMLGAMAALDIAMNFMNIFVSTMIIGIGVDYGIHMIHRYRELGDGPEDKLYDGLVETGKAIVLAALSTVVGFGSLSRSHYPGLASMGIVAVLGALSTCLVAISLLPAYVAVRRKARG